MSNYQNPTEHRDSRALAREASSRLAVVAVDAVVAYDFVAVVVVGVVMVSSHPASLSASSASLVHYRSNYRNPPGSALNPPPHPSNPLPPLQQRMQQRCVALRPPESSLPICRRRRGLATAAVIPVGRCRGRF